MQPGATALVGFSAMSGVAPGATEKLRGTRRSPRCNGVAARGSRKICHTDGKEREMALNNWMGDYQSTELGRLHMPGSHDAGTNLHDLDLTLFGTKSNAATQDLTIVEQLMVG